MKLHSAKELGVKTTCRLSDKLSDTLKLAHDVWIPLIPVRQDLSLYIIAYFFASAG